ncbi:MAG: DUF11 domain-containing protein [Bacteroidetes bacterium]|nr:DUF11 domain-containing protein [Bacteroidota bacterium]
MKTRISVFAAVVCAFVLLGTTSAFAAGTPAGTEIKNVAKMTYKDLSGASFDTLYSDTAKTTVQQIAGVTLTPTGSLQYSSDSMWVYFPHTVTNTGNGTDSYNLISADSASWVNNVVFDADGDGVWDTGETTPVTSISNLMADSTYKIIVRLFVPNGTVSSLLDTIRTTVTSTYVDPGPNAYPTQSAWVRDSIRTRVTQISLSKTNDNGNPIPGDTIEYTIDYTNNGTGTGEGATLYDTLDANVTYLPGSINVVSGGGTAAFSGSPNRIVWSNIGNAGDIYGGMTGQLKFKVTVNANVPAGTTLSNTAYLVYTDSISGRTKRPPGGPSTSTVESDGGWDLDIAAISNSFVTNNDDDSVNVSQVIEFKIKLTNTGNRQDTATWARTSSLPLTWELFRDTDEDGVYDLGTDTPFIVGTDSVIVAQGDSIFLIARDSIAQNQTDRARDSANYVVTSVFLPESATGYHITRVKAPVMTLTKSVTAQNGRSRPGDTLIYTITYTNTGSGSANQIVISDVSPNNTTYIEESVRIDNSANGGTGNGSTYVSKTDTGDADEVTESSGTITVSLGSVGPRLLGDATHTGKIQFKVKID